MWLQTMPTKLVVGALSVWAILPTPPAGAQPAPVALTYAVYLSGFDVADMQAGFTFSQQSYQVHLAYQMTGAVGFLFSGHGSGTVDGYFQGDAAQPRELFSTGQMRGRSRVTQIDWQDGHPTIMQMVPPLEPEREPVPVTEQAHTIDSLSAMAVLLHRVWTAGRCEGDTRTFDGRYLSEVAAKTVGEESLDATSRSIFHGVALRCDIEGRQLAGFWRDADEATLHKPHRASVWFARLAPGGPFVPVRITIETRGFGSATMYLTSES